jgi:hypothetical protein
MNEQAHIENAYGVTVATIFNAFLTSFVTARGDATVEAAAEKDFRDKIARARRARDRAVAVLP